MTWLPSTITAAPSEEPVTVTELKQYARVDGADFDADITNLGKAARAYVEQVTGTCLVTQTRRLACSAWSDLVCLPIGPVQSITSIKYLDENGTEQTLSSSIYSLIAADLNASIRLNALQAYPDIFAAADAIRIVAVVGYGAATAVPDDIKMAMRFLVSQWFDNRTPYSERVPTELPFAVSGNLANHRIPGF